VGGGPDHNLSLEVRSPYLFVVSSWGYNSLLPYEAIGPRKINSGAVFFLFSRGVSSFSLASTNDLLTFQVLLLTSLSHSQLTYHRHYIS